MTLLSVRDITKGYEGVDLLRGVSLVLDEGARVGLVGANASGKSTLLRILAGVLEPDSGERVTRRNMRLGYLTQAPELPDQIVREVVRGGLEGREEVEAEIERVHTELAESGLEQARMESLLTRQAALDSRLELLGGYDVEHRVEEVVKHLGLLDPDARCSSLSGGERRRVALARMLVDRPDLMLLDEPTNHLDAVVIDWLEDFLLESRTPFLMVTHDRYFLDRVVDRIIELDHGVLHEYGGNYTDYMVARSARLSAEGSAESARQNLLRRETAWMRRGPPARSTKAKARIQRFHELVDAEPEADLGELELTIPPGPRLGTKVVRVKGAAKSYGERLIVPPLELELHPGDRLGIIGPNGAGKTTLLKLMTNRLEPDTGTVEIGETVAFSIVDQHRQGLDSTKSVVEEVAGNSDHVVIAGQTVRVEGFLEKLLFSGKRKHTAIGSLSGGEQNRVLIAKLLIQGGNVLVLDEPTNDLDLDTLRRLEEALLAFAGCTIVVSHDRYFLDRIATRVLYLDGEGGARSYPGAVSDLLAEISKERRESERNRAPRAKSKSSAATKTTTTKKARIAPWEARELSALPAELEATEAELAALDAKLADPELYKGPPTELAPLRTTREEAAARLETLYARWEELEAKSAN